VQVGFSCAKATYDCTYGMEVANNQSSLVEVNYNAYFYDDRDVIIDSQENTGLIPANSSAYFGGDFYPDDSSTLTRVEVELEAQTIDHKRLEEQLETVGLIGKNASHRGQWLEVRQAKYEFDDDGWGSTSELTWEIHNPFDMNISKLTLGVVFYDSNGKIIGGNTTYTLKPLRRKSTTRASEYMNKDFPKAASVKVSANWGYLLELGDK
jgi:hypothetical protein